jgi:hypothetical protein
MECHRVLASFGPGTKNSQQKHGDAVKARLGTCRAKGCVRTTTKGSPMDVLQFEEALEESAAEPVSRGPLTTMIACQLILFFMWVA